jgi:hypothetical protein
MGAITKKDQREKFELVKQTVAELAEKNGGLVHPVDVVEAARDPASPLHSEFEWDDSAAADAFRLVQAGALLRRMKVTVVKEGATPKVVNVRLMHSLPSDRANGGGYRMLPQIVASPELSADLRQQAIRELQAFRRKYEDIAELGPVMKAIEQVTPAV